MEKTKEWKKKYTIIFKRKLQRSRTSRERGDGCMMLLPASLVFRRLWKQEANTKRGPWLEMPVGTGQKQMQTLPRGPWPQLRLLRVPTDKGSCRWAHKDKITEQKQSWDRVSRKTNDMLAPLPSPTPTHLTEPQMIDPGDRDQRIAVIAMTKMFWEIWKRINIMKKE